jgi:hypothetical protein
MPSAGDLLAGASLNVIGEATDAADCHLTLDGTVISNRATVQDASSFDTPIGLTGYAASVTAGAHTITLECAKIGGPAGDALQAWNWAIHGWQGA